MGSLGYPEFLLLLLITLLTGVLFIWPAWRVVGKTGFPGGLALFGLLPFGALVLLIVLAVVEWPVHRELRQARGGAAGA